MEDTLVKKDCIQLLATNYVGHLAYIENNIPFILPITYYYDPKENAVFSYSGEGHKIEAMRINKNVSLQVENIQGINNWKSVLVLGSFNELQGSAAKMYLHKFTQGVKNLLAKNEITDAQFINDFSNKLNSGSASIVYRIKINDIIGKYNKR
tara:strand:+ start:1880 stop:2335 length:456 start_codon:yes stop_codon:yes gene_type:complete